MSGRLVVALVGIFFATCAIAKEEPPLLSDPTAAAFGKLPDMWGARLSPDGSKIAFLSMYKADMPILAILDVKTGKLNIILSSVPDKADLKWCDWANNERLLCGYYGIERFGYVLVPFTRLVGINADGSKTKVLLQRKLAGEWSQFQDNVIDWLPDDPRHVLVQVPVNNGTGVAKLDIYSGSTETEARIREAARGYMTDGHGEIRLYYYYSDDIKKWYYKLADDSSYKELLSAKTTDDLDYYPVGFGANRNLLYVVKPHEGHMALWTEDLAANRKSTLVFANPDVDVESDNVYFRGKYRRLVAVSYETEKPHLYFFDDLTKVISNGVSNLFPGKKVIVTDESWDQKYFLIYVYSDRDPGNYFLFDVAAKQLRKLFPPHPALEGRELAAVNPIRYKAQDGVEIPGYLTLPPGGAEKNLPLVVLPHGGPSSRDSWGFDILPQFFAAKGYAVLQMNYRGSGGYGEDWEGEGGFRAWRQVMADIKDGVDRLVADGIADPNRLCIVGWSYGGYASLMSGIEQPDRYKCIASIAGVSDPLTMIRDYRNYLGAKAVKEFISTDEAVIEQGSPMRRAAEIKAPVLLFHGDKDKNVYITHSEKMEKALKNAGRTVEFIRYKGVEHQIYRNKYRIDLLSRLGAFLDRHIGPEAGLQAASKP